MTYDNSYDALVASVQATKQEGELYNVEIQVNEEAVVYSNGAIQEQWLDMAFDNYYPNWNYDE